METAGSAVGNLKLLLLLLGLTRLELDPIFVGTIYLELDSDHVSSGN